MPYLTSKIGKHNDNCPNPFNVKRLLIKDYVKPTTYGEKGKQKVVPYGLTCLSCNKIVREYKLGAKEEELDIAVINKKRTSWGFPPTTLEEIERNKRHEMNKKIRRYARKLSGEEPITPQENGYRQRIKGYNELYTSKYEDGEVLKKNGINWDVTLVQKFLDIRPTIAELHQVIYSSPLQRYDRSNRSTYLTPYKPDPDKPGKFRYDYDGYVELVVKEARLRNKLMNEIIECHIHPKSKPKQDKEKEATVIINKKKKKKS